MSKQIFAQISDLHFLAHPDYAILEERLIRYVEHLNKMQPQLNGLIISGDICNDGLEEDYAKLQTILQKLKIPYYCCKGNHDDGALIESYLSPAIQSHYGEKYEWRMLFKNWQMICLDSTVANKPEGYLQESSFSFLDQMMQDNNIPTIVMFHHQPFLTGIHHMDEYTLKNYKTTYEHLLKYAQIKGVICGHVHQFISKQIGHIRLYSCPSFSYAFQLNLQENAPIKKDFSQPPAYLIHTFSENDWTVYLQSFTQ